MRFLFVIRDLVKLIRSLILYLRKVKIRAAIKKAEEKKDTSDIESIINK